MKIVILLSILLIACGDGQVDKIIDLVEKEQNHQHDKENYNSNGPINADITETVEVSEEYNEDSNALLSTKGSSIETVSKYRLKGISKIIAMTGDHSLYVLADTGVKAVRSAYKSEWKPDTYTLFQYDGKLKTLVEYKKDIPVSDREIFLSSNTRDIYLARVTSSDVTSVIVDDNDPRTIHYKFDNAFGFTVVDQETIGYALTIPFQGFSSNLPWYLHKIDVSTGDVLQNNEISLPRFDRGAFIGMVHSDGYLWMAAYGAGKPHGYYERDLFPTLIKMDVSTGEVVYQGELKGVFADDERVVGIASAIDGVGQRAILLGANKKDKEPMVYTFTFTEPRR